MYNWVQKIRTIHYSTRKIACNCKYFYNVIIAREVKYVETSMPDKLKFFKNFNFEKIYFHDFELVLPSNHKEV